MSDPFLDDEDSVEASRPEEVYEISYSTTTLRYTSSSRDVVAGGFIYTSIPIQRSTVNVVQSNDAKNEFTFTVPIDNPLVRRWLDNGIPPQRVSVIVSRYQSRSGLLERIWNGYIISMGIDDDCTEATFNGPGHLGSNLLRIIPNITAGRRCPYTLYGPLCTVDPDGSAGGLAFKVTTPVLFVSGRDVRVDLGSTGRNGTWSRNGKLIHVASGEQMTIRDQVDANPGFSSVATLSLQFAIAGLTIGDSVEIHAGCDWSIETCQSRFANKDNFGGFNRMPTRQVFSQVLGGFGDIVSGEL